VASCVRVSARDVNVQGSILRSHATLALCRTTAWRPRWSKPKVSRASRATAPWRRQLSTLKALFLANTGDVVLGELTRVGSVFLGEKSKEQTREDSGSHPARKR